MTAFLPARGNKGVDSARKSGHEVLQVDDVHSELRPVLLQREQANVHFVGQPRSPSSTKAETQLAELLPAPRTVTRGLSRFRLRVRLVGSGVKPYGWEIYDDEDGDVVRRSAARFRTSAEAWQAGAAVIGSEEGA